MNENDVTILRDRLMPKTWMCPHCFGRNSTGLYANEIIMEHFKYLENCEKCGSVHFWKLEWSDSFKQKIVDMLREGKLVRM